MELPDGLTTRALELGGARAVFELIAAQQAHDIAEVVIDEADIVSDWQRPSHDLSQSTIGVFDGDRLVAFAELSGADRSDAAVEPTYRGRGIGTALAYWLQDRARARGSTVVGMPVPQGSPGDLLLENLGYRVRWVSWVLALPDDRVIEERDLPSGYSIRAAREEDHRAAWEVVEGAFLEWSDRQRQSYEDFAAQVMERPGFEPWNLRVATESAAVVVGVAFLITSDDVGFVEKLAVHRDHRNRGLGRALLADAFSEATWDQGSEMGQHVQFSIDTGIAVYFCDPHSPWQRGTVENTNRLLRQYFPHRANYSPLTEADLDLVTDELNQRPRKTLGYRTPAEVLDELIATTT
jgi:GNAT superfamily N-acetyltransferase